MVYMYPAYIGANKTLSYGCLQPETLRLPLSPHYLGLNHLFGGGLTWMDPTISYNQIWTYQKSSVRCKNLMKTEKLRGQHTRIGQNWRRLSVGIRPVGSPWMRSGTKTGTGPIGLPVRILGARLRLHPRCHRNSMISGVVPRGVSKKKGALGAPLRSHTRRRYKRSTLTLKGIKWICLKMGYTPNYSHLVGIMIINHWV